MSVINLYNQLTNARPGGTWTRVSTGGPAAPALYNGVVDFYNYLPSDYVYRYSVTYNNVTDTSEVTVSWQGVAPDRVNDICDTAKYISGVEDPGITATISDSNLADCPNLKAPTIPNPIDYPTVWNQGTYTGDLWYYMKPGQRDLIYTVNIVVDSINYTNGAAGFAIEVYTSNTFDCDPKTLIGRQVANKNSDELKYSFLIAPGTSPYVFFRVVSITAGEYDITVTTSGEVITTSNSVTRYVKNVYDESGTGAILWNILTDGNIDTNINSKFEVYANGKRLEYPAEFTVTRYDTPTSHLITILSPIPMTYYTLISFV